MIMRLQYSILYGTILSTFMCYSASDTTEEATVGPVEVCERETFEPVCAENRVLLVRSAQYGRMSLGRCVTKDYGYVGCSVDVTGLLHALCSGRPSCQVHGSHPALMDAKSTSCAKDFASYLSVTYLCVPVASGSRHSCSQHGSLVLSASNGFIASHSAMTSGYGAVTCPWKLVPPGGRRLNISLDSFGTEEHIAQPPCYKFATITDFGGAQEIVGCAGDPSERIIFISEGGPVTLSFSQDVIQGRMGYFLIHYNVLECLDPEIPANSRFTRKDAKIGEISCQNLDLKWTVRCQDGQWSGHVGRCESGAFGSIDTTNTYGLLAVVSIGALIGMLVGGLFLWICICCFRKCQRRENHPRHLVPPEDLDYMTHFHKPWMSQAPAQPNWVDFGTMGRGHYETLPRLPNGHAGPKEYDQLNVRTQDPESDYFITIAENNNEHKSRDNEDISS